MLTKTFRLICLTLLAVSVFAPANVPHPATAQAGATYFITEVATPTFPDVTFTLRAVDLSNQVITNLNSDNISVYENGELMSGVEVTPHDDGPLNLIFVLDQGRTANYNPSFGLNNIRLVMTTLGNYFVNGRDTVLVLGRQNINSDQTVTLLKATQNSSDLLTWAAGYEFKRSTNNTKALEGVEGAIAEMNTLVPVPGSATTVVVLITRYIEDPSNQVALSTAQTTADLAKQNFITVHVFQTDPTQTYKQPLEILASSSYGQYAPLLKNSLQPAVDAVYKAINAQRTYYTVTYRSATGAGGQRQITINASAVPASGVSGTYEVNPLAANLTLIEPPANSVLRREPGPNDSLSRPTFTVTAELNWPDGFARTASAALYLGDSPTPEAQLDLSASETRMTFNVDISHIVKTGANVTGYTIKLTDELGLEASVSSSLTVEVVPTPTPAPTATPTVSEQILGTGETDGGVSLWVIVGGLVCVGLIGALVVAVVLGFVFRPRGNTASQAAPAAARAVNPAAGEIQNTLIGGAAYHDKVLATLTILEGPKGLIGEPVNLLKPTSVIGRNPQKTDVTFYADEESSVSRVHATLQLDGKVFKLTDNGSASGTRLNGRKIQANDPVVLADGDEVVFGDLARRGIKARFNIVSDPDQLKYGGSADDRTMIMGATHEDDGDKYRDD